MRKYGTVNGEEEMLKCQHMAMNTATENAIRFGERVGSDIHVESAIADQLPPPLLRIKQIYNSQSSDTYMHTDYWTPTNTYIMQPYPTRLSCHKQ